MTSNIAVTCKLKNIYYYLSIISLMQLIGRKSKILPDTCQLTAFVFIAPIVCQNPLKYKDIDFLYRRNCDFSQNLKVSRFINLSRKVLDCSISIHLKSIHAHLKSIFHSCQINPNLYWIYTFSTNMAPNRTFDAKSIGDIDWPGRR